MIGLGNADAGMAGRLFESFFHEMPDQAKVAALAPRFGAAVAMAGGGAGGGGVGGEGSSAGSGCGGSGGGGGGGGGAHSMAALQGLLLRTRGDPDAALAAALGGAFHRGD